MENDDGPEPEDLAGPYCGCITCDVREILHAAYPHLLAGWEAEELPAALNAAKAKAWDEGYELRASTLGMSSDPNPYRAP